MSPNKCFFLFLSIFLKQWKVTATIFINKNCGLCLPMMGDGDNKGGGGVEDIATIWSIKIVNFIFLGDAWTKHDVAKYMLSIKSYIFWQTISLCLLFVT